MGKLKTTTGVHAPDEGREQERQTLCPVPKQYRYSSRNDYVFLDGDLNVIISNLVWHKEEKIVN